jgi:hypothetical protein
MTLDRPCNITNIGYTNCHQTRTVYPAAPYTTGPVRFTNCTIFPHASEQWRTVASMCELLHVTRRQSTVNVQRSPQDSNWSGSINDIFLVNFPTILQMHRSKIQRANNMINMIVCMQTRKYVTQISYTKRFTGFTESEQLAKSQVDSLTSHTEKP